MTSHESNLGGSGDTALRAAIADLGVAVRHMRECRTRLETLLRMRDQVDTGHPPGVEKGAPPTLPRHKIDG